jgi:hypothetical protein
LVSKVNSIKNNLIMDKISVIFQRDDSSIERTLNISLNEKFGEFRKELQTLLGLRDDISCELVLNRTGKTLVDSLTPLEASIRSGDRIILISSIQSATNNNSHSSSFSKVELERKTLLLVMYNLQIILARDGQQTVIYNYPIDLTEFYEDNPQRFFNESNEQGKQSFVTELQKIIQKELSNYEIDKILQDWCDDISLGYRTSVVKL